MTSCIYDNPTTFMRELWVDGKLCEWISAELLADKKAREYLRQDLFSAGNIVGDPMAMEEKVL